MKSLHTVLCVADPSSPAFERLLDASGTELVRRAWRDSVESIEDAASRADRLLIVVPEPDESPTGECLARTLDRLYRLAMASRKRVGVRWMLLTRLDGFARCPANWHVDEKWRTRPTSSPADMVAHLFEASARELLRETGIKATVVRVGSIAPDAPELADELATAWGESPAPDAHFWRIRHVGRRPCAPADDRPWRQVLAPPEPIASRPIRNVVVFGAGGPMAAALVPLLADRYRLRLTDVRPLADIRATGYPHQPPGSPLPTTPLPPHEEMHCDVADPHAVDAACEGMDAIVNCSVVRYTDRDFAVNTAGCWNIAQSAVRHRIRRVVQTGPQLTGLDPVVGYHFEDEVPGNAPPRPGASMYGHSKFLGNEILRVFAENHGLEVPVLVFNGFATKESRGRNPFQTTFEDSAEAIRLALEVPALPSPWEFITVCNDLPQGRFSAQRATELLGWKASDDLQDTWSDAGQS